MLSRSNSVSSSMPSTAGRLRSSRITRARTRGRSPSSIATALAPLENWKQRRPRPLSAWANSSEVASSSSMMATSTCWVALGPQPAPATWSRPARLAL